MVVIPGHPGAIRNASGAWEVLFSRVEQARSMVDQLSSGLQTWEGSAGESFRGHLNLVSQNMSTLIDTHRPVVQQLNSAADNLQSALDHTPVPDDMVDDVLRARENYAATGNIEGSYKPGFFYDMLFPIFHNRWLAEIGSFLTFGFTDWVARKLRNWLTDEDEKAKAAYRQLAGQHVSTMDGMPQAASMLPSDLQAALVTPGLPPGASTPGAVPGLSLIHI